MKKQVGNKLRGSAGFTLVELIVVIAVLGILAGIGTVGYSGYVKKAHQAADIQLAGDVNYALQLYGASNPSMAANQRKGAMLGYVLLTEGNPEVSDPAMVEALKNMFGADYANALKLSYDNWTPEMLSAAAGGAAESVTNSSYITGAGTDKLLTDVQKCTTGLSGFMEPFLQGNTTGAVGLLSQFFNNASGGNAFLKSLESAGYTDANSYSGISKEALGNATVFGVADYVKSNEELVQATMSSMDLVELPMSVIYTNAMNGSGVNLLATAALWYASMEGLASHLQNEAMLTAIRETNLDATTVSGICAQMDTVYNALSDELDNGNIQMDDISGYYSNPSGGTSQAQVDAEAFISIMNTVDSVSDQYSNAADLNNATLMTDSGISNQLNNYVTGAEVSTDLAGKYDGSSGIVYLLADGKGGVTGSVDMVDKRA